MITKITWQGVLTSVQPRIRLVRSFDERSHRYLGYVLAIRGVVDDQERDFLVGIGKTAQARHQFRAGDVVGGASEPVRDSRIETAEFYKTSKLKLIERGAEQISPPPWREPPPTLEIYRARGHRRLDARTYATKCCDCVWGCRMPVEMIIDQWNPQQRRYRFETFCYGPQELPASQSQAHQEGPGPPRHDLGGA